MTEDYDFEELGDTFLAPGRPWSEIHPNWWDFERVREGKMEHEKRRARCKVNAAIAKITSDFEKSGEFPVDFERAAGIADWYCKRGKHDWYSAVSQLVDQRIPDVKYYFKVELPEMIFAQERAADQEDSGFDLDTVPSVFDDIDEIVDD